MTQQWSIRVTQYEMSFPNKAPKGCLQYHFAGDGDNDGNEDATQIRSFNWNAGNRYSCRVEIFCLAWKNLQPTISFSKKTVSYSEYSEEWKFF